MYLGAAALKKPSSAWPLFFGTFVVITADRFGVASLDATWILIGLAVLLLGYGLLRGAAHPIDGLPLQAIAMAGFGAVAAIDAPLSPVGTLSTGRIEGDGGRERDRAGKASLPGDADLPEA